MNELGHLETIHDRSHLTINSERAEDKSAIISHCPLSWIEINKQSLEHNLALYKKIVGPMINLALVVKGNAYGHGILEISRIAETNPHVDWLCTATLSEALLLRANNITKPIIVLSIIDLEPQEAAAHNIDVIASDVETITALNAQASQCNKKINVHLKIDTGLSRFGTLSDQAVDYVRHAFSLPHINVRGIFSHFSESDNQDATYTQQQLVQFTALLDTLRNHSLTIPYVHMSNSAAATIIPPARFNFVRIGAGAYGLESSDYVTQQAQSTIEEFALRPVMAWKTQLTNIRTVPSNSYVGYAKTHLTSSPTRIGIIPVGYYDGYDRRLSNRGVTVVTSIKGKYAPVIGRVCMNATMIDLSEIPESKVGDEVLLLGDLPRLRAHELANAIESFNPREITTRINPLVRRVVV